VPDALTLEKKFMAFNQKCEFMDFRQFSEWTVIIYLQNIIQLISLMDMQFGSILLPF
jgi:hypothetical protein